MHNTPQSGKHFTLYTLPNSVRPSFPSAAPSEGLVVLSSLARRASPQNNLRALSFNLSRHGINLLYTPDNNIHTDNNNINIVHHDITNALKIVRITTTRNTFHVFG